MNEALLVLRETAVVRVAISPRERRIEVLLLVLPEGDIDVSQLGLRCELLRTLQAMGFQLTHQEGGWVSCETDFSGDRDEASERVLRALEMAGI